MLFLGESDKLLHMIAWMAAILTCVVLLACWGGCASVGNEAVAVPQNVDRPVAGIKRSDVVAYIPGTVEQYQRHGVTAIGWGGTTTCGSGNIEETR
jgi:hypothetical protein